VSLDEHPAQIIRNAQTLGLNSKSRSPTNDSDHVRSPQELDIDAHYARIVQLIEERDVQRM